MSVVTVRNTRQGDDHPPIPPVHDDGSRYPYAMYYSGAKYIAYADTPTDLLTVLIPDYDTLDERGRMMGRIRLAIDAQVVIQAQINAETDDEQWARLSDQERSVLEGSRVEQPRVDFWDCEIPLVLVETGYAPYSDVNQPLSGISDVRTPPNLIWLRPVDEWELLVSLAEAGYITLHEATPDPLDA